MSGNSIRDTFFEECEELLEALVEGLAAMEDSDCDLEIVNAVFRSVHSIKGGAGAFALDELVAFAHTFETVMDKVRSRQLDVNADLMLVFHRSGDTLADLVEAARDDRECNIAQKEALSKELESYLGEEDVEEEFSFDAMSLDLGGPIDIAPLDGAMADIGASGDAVYTIKFTPTRGLYENGHEPLLLFDALAELGTLSVQADLTRLPDLDDYDPYDAPMAWTLTLTTGEPEMVLHEVFEFVEGLCTLDISVEQEVAAAALPALPDLDLSTDAQPEAPELKTKDPAPDASATPAPTVRAPEARAAPAAPKTDKDSKGPKPTLRVDLDRVDRLINTVGELIINQAMISQRIEELDLPTVAHLTNELEAYKLLARDIQEGVMAIRAQPVKPLFQRMSRIVREASEATGKTARLETAGDSTEVDKTVIERLADPLTHMIRNAVDHGLESPDVREAAGKIKSGRIRLSACHRSGSVFIEVADDGAGLNRDKILETATRKNLVSPETELTDTEIDNLLFLPGFSTANQVSNLSGRGVGMDVVKNAVTALGGRISITSTPGEGTTFTIILPLTLAVLDGFVISVGSQTMVIPIASILETVRPTKRDLHQIGVAGQVLSVRGSYVPVVDVARHLGLADNGKERGSGVLLLVNTEASGMTALRVDAIHDQRQVVIKSLENNYGAIKGVSAATILGDGKIALILDPDELVKLSSDSPLPAAVQAARQEARHA